MMMIDWDVTRPIFISFWTFWVALSITRGIFYFILDIPVSPSIIHAFWSRRALWPVTRHLRPTFSRPVCEFYAWSPPKGHRPESEILHDDDFGQIMRTSCVICAHESISRSVDDFLAKWGIHTLLHREIEKNWGDYEHLSSNFTRKPYYLTPVSILCRRLFVSRFCVAFLYRNNFRFIVCPPINAMEVSRYSVTKRGALGIFPVRSMAAAPRWIISMRGCLITTHSLLSRRLQVADRGRRPHCAVIRPGLARLSLALATWSEVRPPRLADELFPRPTPTGAARRGR